MCDSYLCSNKPWKRQHLPPYRFSIDLRSFSVSFPFVLRFSFASPSLLLRFLLATEAESSEEVADPEQRRKEDTTMDKRGERGEFLPNEIVSNSHKGGERIG